MAPIFGLGFVPVQIETAIAETATPVREVGEKIKWNCVKYRSFVGHTANFCGCLSIAPARKLSSGALLRRLPTTSQRASLVISLVKCPNQQRGEKHIKSRYHSRYRLPSVNCWLYGKSSNVILGHINPSLEVGRVDAIVIRIWIVE